ncbi:hypothetical protein [Streptomyces sp. NEAU-S77]
MPPPCPGGGRRPPAPFPDGAGGLLLFRHDGRRQSVIAQDTAS